MKRLSNRFKTLITLIFAISCQLWTISCSAASAASARVAIIQNIETLRLKVRGSYEIVDGKTQKSIGQGYDLKTTVMPYNGGIQLGERFLNTYKVSIRTAEPEAISVNDRWFRGQIQLIINTDGNLLVVNCIELQDYVKGILYHEASHYWPMEALKAQAIISRTYAVYQMDQNKDKEFDLTSGIYSQVYGGRASERYRTNKAVEFTAGLVLTYKGKVFPAYFHATCGGHTEDASRLWNINLAPLKGVVCSYCKESPHFKWHYVLSAKELKERLAKNGYRVSDIQSIAVLGKDDSWRVTEVKLIGRIDQLLMPAKDFRAIVGSDLIRSTNFSVDLVNGDVVFEGLGWGHGVGLCQWGAYFMAKQGKTAKEILSFYYPGSNVETFHF